MLASEILHEQKQKCRFWKIATCIVLAVAIVEFVVMTILF